MTRFAIQYFLAIHSQHSKTEEHNFIRQFIKKDRLQASWKNLKAIEKNNLETIKY